MDNEKFFLVIPPGLEQSLLLELKLRNILEKTKLEYGGIEVETTLDKGLSLNRYLKTPTNILLRITSFKCRDLPTLYKKVKKFNWAPYLSIGPSKIVCSSSSSRLFDSRKIEKAFRDGIEDHLKAQAPKLKNQERQKIFSTTIHLRFVDDLLTISIDTSGERLEKRGEGKKIGEAPLRETIASALYLSLLNCNNEIETLIDPMCGSGTFLKEVRDLNKTSARQFAYEGFPLSQNLEMNRLKSLKPISIPETLVGADISEKATEIARGNIGIESPKIEITNCDFKDLSLPGDTTVISNPPYGKRLLSQEEVNNLYKDIAIFLGSNKIKSWGLLVPKHLAFHFEKFPTKFLQFKNGGIDVKFLMSTNSKDK